MKVLVIGCGAAGNKAAVAAIRQNVITEEDMLLINSTSRDCPNDYQKKLVLIGEDNDLGGCAKEPKVARKLCLKALQSGSLNIKQFVKPDTKMIIIVGSTEGGTGSGSIPILADYIRQVIGIPTHIFAFLGFEEDARGLLNTVNFFKNLNEDLTIEAVRNKNFIANYKANYLQAENAANMEFVTRLSILMGNPIVASEKNIDERDLYKVSTQTGYMDIEYKELTESLKNIDHYNSIIRDMIDNSKSLRTDSQSQKILAIIINVPEKEISSIDYSCSEIIDKYGRPFEKFTHVQSVPGMKSFIAFISAGLELPLDEVRSVYERYLDATTSVKKNRDSFFAELDGLDEDEDDEIFDLENKQVNTTEESSFFDLYGFGNSKVTDSNNKFNKY